MSGCGSCDGGCCSRFFVPLTDADLRRLVGRGFGWGEVVDFLPVGSVGCGFPDVRVGSGYGYVVLRRGVDGRCCLGEDVGGRLRCRAHGGHPLLCRLFPYRLDGSVVEGKCGDSGSLEAGVVESGLAELEAYGMLADAWNRRGRVGRGVGDFMAYLGL